jgi:hypothetical protein
MLAGDGGLTDSILAASGSILTEHGEQMANHFGSDCFSDYMEQGERMLVAIL